MDMRNRRILGNLDLLWRSRGRRYVGCTLENFQASLPAQQKAVAAVRDYLADIAANVTAGRGVIFYGRAGTGKDHLLAALMRGAVEADLSVLWRGGMDLFAAFRDRIDANADERGFTAELAGAAVLAISDPLPPFGDLTPYQASKLFEVIDRRYSNCRPTWMTLNAGDGHEASKALGTAIVDRLREDALLVPCDWPSWRQRDHDH